MQLELDGQQTPVSALNSWLKVSLTCRLSSGAAGCPLSSASPVPHSASEVQVGQNVSLTCNLTSSVEITWYLLRSDQLLPLLTGKQSKLKGDSIIFHSTNSRINWERDQQSGLVSLKIHRVEEEDAGLYFCTERSEGKVLVNEGIRLTVNGKS
uniref:Ig-like domain-containing protein n=1 Tax=Stegastes partitus TaxID=144197 RepID=A0A3B4ZMS2_9TELE